MTESPFDHDRPDEANGKRESLEFLFAEFVERLNSGESIDPQEIIEKHPELSADLLREIDTFESLQTTGVASTDEEPLGTLGDYTLKGQIGRGGMGVVYEAWQTSLDRHVALKVLPPGIAADVKSSTRFIREAQIAAKLTHTNIVPVFATGVEGDTPYYAMEFVEGKTLAKVLAKIKEAEPESDTVFGKKDCAGYFENLARAFADVADGLQHAHSKGVTHRDIKPSNLILDSEGRLRILDFGLARLEGQESLTTSGDLVGTPLYMSPEQARQKKIQVDHRTDIYSLGATMYEAVCGRPPFKGKDHQDTLSQIIEHDPVEPKKLNQRISKELDTIVLKCLRKEPADRYGTAEALGQDLRRFVRGDPIEARPQSPLQKVLLRIARNRRAIVTRTIMVTLLLACATLIYLLFVSRPRGKEHLFKNVMLMEAVNSPYLEGSPVPSADGLEFFFTSGRPERPEMWNIWVIRRSSRMDPWRRPELVEDLNTSGPEKPSWLSHDGLRIYYEVTTEAGPRICCATRKSPDAHARWRPQRPEILAEINKLRLVGAASLTEDETEIFFNGRQMGTRHGDIWTATRRNRDAPWGNPRSLEEINTKDNERTPCISPDGLTLFFGRVSGDIWYTVRPRREEDFGPAQRLSPLVNSEVPLWEGSFRVSPRWPELGSFVYFAAAIKDEMESFDIYRATWCAAEWPPRLANEVPLKE